jgi:hypothetical protein
VSAKVATGDPLTDPSYREVMLSSAEARAEWMAAAVLYEELSSLARFGVPLYPMDFALTQEAQ